jgi:hypothetical protein
MKYTRQLDLKDLFTSSESLVNATAVIVYNKEKRKMRGKKNSGEYMLGRLLATILRVLLPSILS